MLTRLKVSGFKNLVDVDVYFGPFTCIAGANGVGKSNLFDAIKFLSALADKSLIDAALSVRDQGGRLSDIRSLFHRVGDEYDEHMSLEAEMIIADKGVDDLGQEAHASITFLRYEIKLAWRGDDDQHIMGPIELIHEHLEHINLGDAREHLLFPHSTDWRRSAVHGRRTSPFISTEEGGMQRQIKMHQDGKSGRALSRLASSLPRTVLSVATADSPTALLVRREMQFWRLLQLEPSSLRKPDDINAPAKLGADGSHLPATLYHLARSYGVKEFPDDSSDATEHEVYGVLGNRLFGLLEGIRSVWVERDDRRELLTLFVKDREHTKYPARALSDGTLRFLALAVLHMEPGNKGVLCLEEPENGIHPERIPAMLQLLMDIATDVNQPISSENPLRQVIINTHSPVVVAQVDEDSLLLAALVRRTGKNKHFSHVVFSGLSNTWRLRAPGALRPVSIGTLLTYLNPIGRVLQEDDDLDGRMNIEHYSATPHPRRVIDREELRDVLFVLPFGSE